MQIYNNLSLDNLDGEEWAKIEGSNYQVSNLGRMKFSDNVKEKIVFVSINDRGYRRQCFYVNGERITRKVARLVADLFVLGKSEINKEINHIDGDKLNDAAGNLEWTTRSKNVKHAFDNGLMKATKGIDHGNACICMHIEYGYFCTLNEAAEISNKLRSNMWKELNGRRRNSTKFVLCGS